MDAARHWGERVTSRPAADPVTEEGRGGGREKANTRPPLSVDVVRCVRYLNLGLKLANVDKRAAAAARERGGEKFRGDGREITGDKRDPRVQQREQQRSGE